MNIKLLPQQVIEQIAAGEILERPSYLVKELIENSLDAKATEIDVEYQNGGKHVRIQDNGIGIEKDDLSLALQRHATSKIHASEDLWRLSSYGFRGEALASIAAVSELQIISKTVMSESAHRLISKFGQIETINPVQFDNGTLIEIKNLFSNVPARLKFLKSEVSESSQIKKTLKALALAHPQISFRIKSGQILTLWKPESFLDRAQRVLETSSLFSVEKQEGDFQISILFSSPDEAVRSSQNIWIFVQDRWVQDRSLQAAIFEAYRNLLMVGEFPIVVLKIQVPKDEVDVNVHPTKTQVKFLDSQKVFRLVHSTLRQALEKAPWNINILQNSYFKNDILLKKEINPNQSIDESLLTSQAFLASNDIERSNPNNPNMNLFKDEETRFSKKYWQVKPGYDFQTTKYELQNTKINYDKQGFWGKLQIIGQVQLTFLITQSDSELIIIDQHAAHERILFEKLQSKYSGNKVEIQKYLLPYVFDFAPEEMELILSSQDDLKKLGVEIEQVGPQSIQLVAAPEFLKEKALILAIENLVQEKKSNTSSLAIEKTRSEILSTMACHSAIRAGQALSLEEISSLVKQMDDYPLSGYCPHGRPVSIRYSFNTLEKEFGRI